jgi:hypothetical protein
MEKMSLHAIVLPMRNQSPIHKPLKNTSNKGAGSPVPLLFSLNF